MIFLLLKNTCSINGNQGFMLAFKVSRWSEKLCQILKLEEFNVIYFTFMIYVRKPKPRENGVSWPELDSGSESPLMMPL